MFSPAILQLEMNSLCRANSSAPTRPPVGAVFSLTEDGQWVAISLEMALDRLAMDCETISQQNSLPQYARQAKLVNPKGNPIGSSSISSPSAIQFILPRH